MAAPVSRRGAPVTNAVPPEWNKSGRHTRGKKEKPMVRRLIAGTAVFGALTLGAGVVAAATPAGAATSKAHKAAHRSHKSDKAAFCARIKKLDARVQARQGKVSGFITAVQQGESALAASGNTTQANALAQGVKWIQSHESKVNARL